MVEVALRWAEGADRELGLPFYASAGAAGADLRANLPEESRKTGLSLSPGARILVPTGLHIELPSGFEAQIRPRSGLALKFGITLPNSPGTIDSDYRGPLGVILLNAGQDVFEIAHGDRIAQLIVAPVVQAQFGLSQNLSASARGQGGFGSTGRQ
ncbi:MAG: dUTP diphosphatase [Pseudomonadota bacterium]